MTLMRRRDICLSGMALIGTSAIARAPRRVTIDVASIDRARVIRQGNRLLGEQAVTLTSYAAPRSPGGPHDYYSEADYWWPDPAAPNGPYVNRDGYSNPAKFVDHRNALIRLSVIVPALAAAWSLSGDQRYALAAERHLDAWFVTPATRMSPNLDHAQAIIGRNTGRGIGVIDTLHLVEVARAIAVLDVKEPGRFTLKNGPAIRSWFADYLTWMTTSKNGTSEREEKNNHGSCWVLQVAEFARLTGNGGITDLARMRFRTRLIPEQIAPDGSQPRELVRTKPYSYCLFNLDVLATAARILSRDDDLWRFETGDGRSLAKALAFMAPYIADKTSWPKPPDVENFADLPVRQVGLLFGGLALNKPTYLALWRRLEPEPSVPEVIRNFPIRQPVLWI